MSTLVDRRIRFSQPADLNDPHEGAPQVSAEFTKQFVEHQIAPILKSIPVEAFLADTFRRKYGTLPAAVQLAVSEDDFVQHNLSSVSHQLPEFRRFYEELVAQQIADAGRLKDELGKIMSSKVNDKFGVLSLSEDPLVQLLWGHYGAGDRGFLIGFDGEDPFFSPANWESLTAPLQKVTYADTKPELLEPGRSEENDLAILFTKPSCWSYEKEWRALRRLEHADEILDQKPFAVCLFSFPAGAVKEVVLGARTSEDDERFIRESISDKDCSHIRLYRVVNDGYSLGLELA